MNNWASAPELEHLQTHMSMFVSMHMSACAYIGIYEYFNILNTDNIFQEPSVRFACLFMKIWTYFALNMAHGIVYNISRKPDMISWMLDDEKDMNVVIWYL